MERIREFRLTSNFIRHPRALPKEQARKLWKALAFLTTNRDHPSLHKERIVCGSRTLWSIRIDESLRLIFQENDAPILLYVGPHEDAYRYAQNFAPTAELRKSLPLGNLPVSAQASPEVELVPPLRLESKYLRLCEHLQTRRENEVEMDFQGVERIVGERLPPSARKHRPWWANDHTHVQAAAWLAVGWKTQQVRLEAERLKFVRS
jgi:mRNA-degrading endonuclease RelE of RelBE toxin-antitoxin system